jgi:hypothetical protein
MKMYSLKCKPLHISSPSLWKYHKVNISLILLTLNAHFTNILCFVFSQQNSFSQLQNVRHGYRGQKMCYCFVLPYILSFSTVFKYLLERYTISQGNTINFSLLSKAV